MTIDEVFAAMAESGLTPRGAFLLSGDERRGALASVSTIVLVGFVGRDGWSWFASSAEALDGLDHALDRWSRRVVEALARDFGAVALFPFGGPPFHPFQRWARRSEPVNPSPSGLLIHPRYGLWHSYRGALGFRDALDVPEPATAPSPCDSCRERPCLNACPVRAFSSSGYDVAACASHLNDPAGADCMDAGCRARRACPVGAAHAYGPGQADFTMRAFLRAQGPPDLTGRD